MEMVEEFKLEAANKSIDFCCTRTSTSQQTFVGLEDVLKTSSRHVFKTSSTCLQCDNFFVFQDVLKASWKTKNCYVEDVLKTPWRQKIFY